MKLDYSEYSNNDVLPLGKKSLYRVLNFFLILILNTALFVVTNTIAINLPEFKDNSSLVNENYNKLNDLIIETHLGEKDGNSYLKSIDSLTTQYLYRVTLGSLKIHNFNEDQISQATYQGVKEISKDLDNNYFYICSYRLENENLYDSIITKQDYLNSFPSFYFEIKNEYPYLNYDTTSALNQYLTNRISGKESYENVKKFFVDKLNSNIEDLKKNNSKYLCIESSYSNNKNYIYWSYIYVSFITYSLVVAILYLLLPLIFKNRESLGNKMCRNTLVYKKSYKPTFLYPIFSTPLFFLFYLIIPIISLFLMYQSSIAEVIILGIFGPISFLHLGLFSLTILALSFLVSVIPINKKRASLIEHLFRIDLVEKN